MTSSNSEMKKISEELNHLSLRKQQLLERKKIQCIFQELKNRVEFEQTEEAASRHETDSIDEELKQLTERKAELQKSLENILNANDNKDSKKEVSVTSCQKNVPGVLGDPGDPGVSASNIFYVEAPPNIAALCTTHTYTCKSHRPTSLEHIYSPKVFLDVENLPTCPCRTQCPECQQFIMTETFTSVSSATWLVCFMMALIGCVAGCCFIPFCIDKFKSTTHRCPNCRTLIRTIKKL